MTRQEWTEKYNECKAAIGARKVFVLGEDLDAAARIATETFYGKCPPPPSYTVNDLDNAQIEITAENNVVVLDYTDHEGEACSFSFDIHGARALLDAIYECAQVIERAA